MLESPVREHMDGRKDEAAQDRYPKAIYEESLDDTIQNPEQESVDDESEDTKGEQVDWQRKEYQDWLDGDIHKSPKKRKDKRCSETLNRDAWHDMRQRKEGEGTD